MVFSWFYYSLKCDYSLQSMLKNENFMAKRNTNPLHTERA